MKAAINKDTEVSQMLMKLVSFYRLSTKVHDSMVTVRKEVDMLDAYMSLMCYRYPEIRYHSDIMPEAMDMEIPNFYFAAIAGKQSDAWFEGQTVSGLGYAENLCK